MVYLLSASTTSLNFCHSTFFAPCKWGYTTYSLYSFKFGWKTLLTTSNAWLWAAHRIISFVGQQLDCFSPHSGAVHMPRPVGWPFDLHCNSGYPFYISSLWGTGKEFSHTMLWLPQLPEWHLTKFQEMIGSGAKKGSLYVYVFNLSTDITNKNLIGIYSWFPSCFSLSLIFSLLLQNCAFVHFMELG